MGCSNGTHEGLRGIKMLVNIDRDDYDLSAWINDLVVIIKKRGWLAKKEDAWIVVQENIREFLELYSGGSSPIEAYNDYAE